SRDTKKPANKPPTNNKNGQGSDPRPGLLTPGSFSQSSTARTMSQLRPTAAIIARIHCTNPKAVHQSGSRARREVPTTARSKASARAAPGGVAGAGTASGHGTG